MDLLSYIDAAAELGRNPVSKHQIQLSMEMSRADARRDCRTRPARPNLRRESGQGNIHFPCSADHEQDWQPYPVDQNSCYVYVVWPYIIIFIFNYVL